jgi:hypothetical protein
MLGLRSPNNQSTAQTTAINVFQTNIAQSWDTFQENFEDENLSSWSGFETWLTDNGVESGTAGNIRTQLESKYPTFSDYSDIVINATSWEDYKTNFKNGSGLRSTLTTQDGLSAAGIQVYEEGGVGRDGQSIPAGSVEVYGTEVHFSQSATPGGAQEPPEDQTDTPVTYSNLTISNDLPVPNEDIDVSVDVANNTNVPGIGVVAELIVDGEVDKTKSIEVAANSTATVSFTKRFEDYGSFDVSIGDTTPQTVTVIHPGLV